MTRRRVGVRGGVLVVTLAVAGWHIGHAAWIEGKASLAQLLVRRAWEREQAGAGDARPWPWADTHPVARLVVPGRDVDLMVLAGASGRTMAFGPGHMSGTPLPGEAGNAVLSGHRDTHFAFLQRLAVGDSLVVERRDGVRRRYVVSRAFVVDHRDTWVAEDTGAARLTLVTCYPFDAIRPGGPLRYVVSAELDEATRTMRAADVAAFLQLGVDSDSQARRGVRRSGDRQRFCEVRSCCEISSAFSHCGPCGARDAKSSR